jgi:hypothetical protein
VVYAFEAILNTAKLEQKMENTTWSHFHNNIIIIILNYLSHTNKEIQFDFLNNHSQKNLAANLQQHGDCVRATGGGGLLVSPV